MESGYDDRGSQAAARFALKTMPTATLQPKQKAMDWSALRADFPVLDQEVHGRPLLYFDNAATTQKPRPVLEALRHYYEHDNANVHRGIHELSNRHGGIRGRTGSGRKVHQRSQRG